MVLLCRRSTAVLSAPMRMTAAKFVGNVVMRRLLLQDWLADISAHVLLDSEEQAGLVPLLIRQENRPSIPMSQGQAVAEALRPDPNNGRPLFLWRLTQPPHPTAPRRSRSSIYKRLPRLHGALLTTSITPSSIQPLFLLPPAPLTTMTDTARPDKKDNM